MLGVLLGALTALALAFVVDLYGWSAAGAPGIPGSTEQVCSAHPLAKYPNLEGSLLPLSARCNWADGTSTQLVPAWVNPAFFTFLSLGTIGPVVGIWLVARRYGTAISRSLAAGAGGEVA
jgi:hypothetical protein